MTHSKLFNLLFLTIFCLSSYLSYGYNYNNIIANDNNIVSGEHTLTINQLTARKLNGEIDDDLEHLSTCYTQFGWIAKNHLINIEYKINTKTGIQQANAHLLHSSVSLYPMGIYGTYSFLSQRGVPDELKELKIRQIYFRMNLEFGLENFAVSFLDDTLGYQCIASI